MCFIRNQDHETDKCCIQYKVLLFVHKKENDSCPPDLLVILGRSFGKLEVTGYIMLVVTEYMYVYMMFSFKYGQYKLPMWSVLCHWLVALQIKTSTIQLTVSPLSL